MQVNDGMEYLGSLPLPMAWHGMATWLTTAERPNQIRTRCPAVQESYETTSPHPLPSSRSQGALGPAEPVGDGGAACLRNLAIA